jgi:hypothetical protein
MAIFGVAMFLDSATDWFDVKESFISLLEAILITSVGFYFTSRGVEKITSTIESKKEKK